MSDCILFSGKFNKGGYGYIGHANGVYMAHQLVWMVSNGKNIPKGKLVMHSCDNPPCINPEHLILGTHKDNSNDKIAKGRGNFGKGGRPEKITNEDMEYVESYKMQGYTAIEACKRTGISRAQYYNKLKRG